MRRGHGSTELRIQIVLSVSSLWSLSLGDVIYKSVSFPTFPTFYAVLYKSIEPVPHCKADKATWAKYALLGCIFHYHKPLSLLYMCVSVCVCVCVCVCMCVCVSVYVCMCMYKIAPKVFMYVNFEDKPSLRVLLPERRYFASYVFPARTRGYRYDMMTWASSFVGVKGPT